MANARALPPLSSELINSIQRVLSLPAQPDDSLDDLSSRFTSIPSLNTYFPDESSLTPANIDLAQNRLAQLRADVQGDIERLQADLVAKDRDGEEDETGSEVRGAEFNDGRMSVIQEVISDLLLQTTRIREKASESSHIVHEITKDIQRLDLAKRNLVSSIGTLRKFGMLASVLSQLEDQLASTPRKYSDIAQSLAAVKNLAATFKSSLRVPRVAKEFKRVQELQGGIRAVLDADFDAFFLQDPSKPVKNSVIIEACGVVDVLGEDVRNSLIDRYCSIELKEYRRIFRATDEAGQLDNISRRFSYFRRLFATYDTDFSRAFPPEWKVGCALCVKWNEITRDDLSAALSKAAPILTVTLLVESLQKTMEFEALLGGKIFDIPYPDMLREVAPTLGIRTPKTMSSAFDAHMGIFVDAQDKALSDILSPHRGVKARRSLENAVSSNDLDRQAVIVLPSSTELFYFYGQNFEQCAKLSNGEMLHDMSGVWSKWLRIYAEDVLIACMKRRDKDRKSLEGKFNPTDVKNACLLINTADYCQTTALELEEKIKEKISEEYREKVTLQAERDKFVGVISTSILFILHELESYMEGPLLTMQRTSWTALENVSGESPYIAELVQAIESVVSIVRDRIEQKKYLRNFYDKVATLVIARFTNALVKSRPLKATGAEQILLDLQGLRSCLLKIPGPQAAENSTYSKSVTKGTTRLETLLKVVNAPVDPPEEFVMNYILLVGDSSFSNFQKVLDLKGTPVSEQNKLLDTFVTVTSTKEELESTSFLSSLDMDPGSSSSLQTYSTPTGSRASTPIVSAGAGMIGGGDGTAGTFALAGSLSSPPLTGGGDSSSRVDGRREPSRMTDLRRLVSFAVRRDTQHTP